MPEDIKEAVEEEKQSQESGSSNSLIKGVVILVLGLTAGGVAIFGIMQLAKGNQKDISIKPAPPEVPVFKEKFIVTRKAEESPVGLKKWVVEPPVVRLNPELSKEEIAQVRGAIKNRRSEYKSRVDTFLKNKDNEFVHESGAKEQLANFIKDMVKEHIPGDWIEEVIIPTFHVSL